MTWVTVTSPPSGLVEVAVVVITDGAVDVICPRLSVVETQTGVVNVVLRWYR